MKIQCTGIVKKRFSRSSEKGERYHIVIEEPGIYPSLFEFTTKLASLFGPPDGPLGVGKPVKATGFANGREREIPKKDGSGNFTKYEIYFTLSSLEPFGGAAPAPAAGDDPEDMPF